MNNNRNVDFFELGRLAVDDSPFVKQAIWQSIPGLLRFAGGLLLLEVISRSAGWLFDKLKNKYYGEPRESENANTNQERVSGRPIIDEGSLPPRPLHTPLSPDQVRARMIREQMLRELSQPARESRGYQFNFGDVYGD